MTSSEFSPHEYFSRVINLWWIVLFATFFGGVLGFIFFHLHPPVYEATATYFVTLDLNRFPTLGVREDLIQYNEDMALNTTGGVLLSIEVLNNVVLQMKNLGQSLTVKDLLNNSTIERKHDIWELRYRSQDPSVAQSIVNTWAQVRLPGNVILASLRKSTGLCDFPIPHAGTHSSKAGLIWT